MISLRNFSVAFLLGLVIFGISAYFIIGSVMPNIIGIMDPTIEPNTEVPTTTTGDDTEITRAPDSKYLTMLLLGLDSGESQFSGEPETDTIMIVHADETGKRFMFTSIPSDTIVSYGGYSMRMGYVYTAYGIAGVTDVIKSLTGLHINYYAIADYDGVKKVYEILGTLKFNVPVDMYYAPFSFVNGVLVQAALPEIDLKMGTQNLKPDQVLQLLRYKGYSNGDIERISIARRIIKETLIQKINLSALPKAPELFENISKYVSTNMSFTDFMNYTEMLFSYSEYTTVDIPYPGEYITENGASYFSPNVETAIGKFKPYR